MYFLVKIGGELIYLPDFQIFEGQETVLRIRGVSGQVVVMPGRREPDRLSVPLQVTAQFQLGPFRVVDRNAIVYHCIAENINLLSGVMTATGIVCSAGPVDLLHEAHQAIQQAVRDTLQSMFRN